MWRRLGAFGLCTVVGCAAPSDEASWLVADALPIPGTETLRVSPRIMDVGQRFGADRPLLFEVHIPAGMVIPGRGLPDVAVSGQVGVADVREMPDKVVLQLEIPTVATPRSDEDLQTGVATTLDQPLFCVVGDTACPWGPNDDGRWRAYRLRNVGGTRTISELQLGSPLGEYNLEDQPSLRFVSVWLDDLDVPLDDHDRIWFGYVGNAPRTSTDWMPGASGRLMARVRFRPGVVGPVDCPWDDPSCWVVPPAQELQDIDIVAGPAAFVEVVAPMDVEVGEAARVQVVVRDAYYNPTRVSGSVQVTANGQAVGAPVTLSGEFRGETTVALQAPGFVRWRAQSPAGPLVVGHWSRVWPAGERSRERLVGDVHIHSGGTGEVAFLPTWGVSDHRGGFTRGRDALRFLRDVSGYDFGALSEHAMPWDGFTMPAGAAQAFGVGGPCELTLPDFTEDSLAWWTASQQDAWEVQEESSDFITFPAFEWHGAMDLPTIVAPMHRLVMYRDHDRAGPNLHPMLPWNERNRPPHCLVHYLEEMGQTPDDVLVMPHAMRPRELNLDWDVTFQPTAVGLSPLFDALVPGSQMRAWTRIGEVFSARAYAEGRDHSDMLLAFEGFGSDPGAERWSFRYGWRDTEAVVGVVGSSDSHSGMPGTNDTRTRAGTKSHRHDPTGAAFVLAPTDRARRDAIYDAMYDRHTYATTGVRAYVDFGMVHQGIQRMGSEIGPVSACSLPTGLLAMMTTSVRLVEVWGVEVGGTRPYQIVGRDIGPNGESWSRVFPVRNPLSPGEPPERWMYYARVMAGPAAPAGSTLASLADGHDDAVWTSPIWVDWSAPGAVCP